MLVICNPTEHDFKYGGEGNGNGNGSGPPWEAWIFCSKCGSIGMVPVEATVGITIVPPDKDGQPDP